MTCVLNLFHFPSPQISKHFCYFKTGFSKNVFPCVRNDIQPKQPPAMYKKSICQSIALKSNFLLQWVFIYYSQFARSLYLCIVFSSSLVEVAFGSFARVLLFLKRRYVLTIVKSVALLPPGKISGDKIK